MPAPPPTSSETLRLTNEAVLGEMMKLAFANMHDYLRFESGGATVDFSRLTRDQAAAITEVTVTTRQESTKARTKEGKPPAEITNVKFKLADKRQALLALARHLGLFGDEFAPPEAEERRADTLDPKARLEIAREIMSVLAAATKTARRSRGKGRRRG